MLRASVSGLTEQRRWMSHNASLRHWSLRGWPTRSNPRGDLMGGTNVVSKLPEVYGVYSDRGTTTFFGGGIKFDANVW